MKRLFLTGLLLAAAQVNASEAPNVMDTLYSAITCGDDGTIVEPSIDVEGGASLTDTYIFRTSGCGESEVMEYRITILNEVVLETCSRVIAEEGAFLISHPFVCDTDEASSKGFQWTGTWFPQTVIIARD